jgi:hypothetical protein
MALVSNETLVISDKSQIVSRSVKQTSGNIYEQLVRKIKVTVNGQHEYHKAIVYHERHPWYDGHVISIYQYLQRPSTKTGLS